MYKEERDVLEEMSQIDEYTMDKFRTLGTSEISIAILGDRLWAQKAKQEGDNVSIFFV